MATPFNIAAPNLPNPSASYNQQAGQQYNNVLRLYFNQIDNAINSPKAAGSSTQIQYNLNGALVGSANFTFDGKNLGIGATPSGNSRFESVSTGAVCAIFRCTTSNNYTSARWYNDVNSQFRSLEIDYAGSAYAGSLVTGGPTGEQAAITTTGTYPLVFGTNNTFRGMFSAGGAFLVGANSSGSTSAKIMSYGDSTTVNLYVSQDTGTSYSTNNYFFTCYNSSSVVAGGIQHTGASTVTFATSSDYRLKTDIVDLTGSGAFIDGLRPVAFTWIEDQVRDVGFIAHEAQVVAPHSAGGVKDAIDKDGKPLYQTIAYGSAEFTANIVAELQSLRARVTQLETMISQAK